MEEVVAAATWLTEGFVDAAIAETAYAMLKASRFRNMKMVEVRSTAARVSASKEKTQFFLQLIFFKERTKLIVR
jgi:hypothetical protein